MSEEAIHNYMLEHPHASTLYVIHWYRKKFGETLARETIIRIRRAMELPA